MAQPVVVGSRVRTPKATRTPPSRGRSKSIPGSDREKVEAAIFFLRCQEWMTKKYVDEIRTKYLNPLVDLCSGKKRTAESVSKSVEPVSSGSARGANAANKLSGAGGGSGAANAAGTDKAAEKLQQALKTLQQADGGEVTQSYRPVAREKTVSLADCCALYRLKTLIEAMQELLDIQASLDKWFENNKANMEMHKGNFKNLLTNAMTSFEMAYVLTELFDVQAVPRQEIQKIKPEYSKYVRPDDNTKSTVFINKPLEGVTTRDYIKKLEGQINHFRTVVYEIAKNLEMIIRMIVGTVRDHHLEVNTKQVAMVIDNLPPRYRFPETVPLTSFTKKLLANPPPIPDSGPAFFNFLDSKSTSLTQKSQSHSRGSRTGSASRKRSTGKVRNTSDSM